MNITPVELQEGNYELIDVLNHKDIVPFIRTYMKKRTIFSLAYVISNVVVFLLIVVIFVVNYKSGKVSFDSALTRLSIGFALAFLLVPLHEYIHALAYKSQGAKKVSYDANLKKFYFMALADQFVANRKEFTIVALPPFLTISISLLLLIAVVNLLWCFTLLGILLTHTAFCSGDFGLLSYLEYHKNEYIVIYDDKAKGLSFFFREKDYRSEIVTEN